MNGVRVAVGRETTPKFSRLGPGERRSGLY